MGQSLPPNTVPEIRLSYIKQRNSIYYIRSRDNFFTIYVELFKTSNSVRQRSRGSLNQLHIAVRNYLAKTSVPSYMPLLKKDTEDISKDRAL